MKALVGAFNQENALVGAFSVIVQPVVEPMEHYTALVLNGLLVPSWPVLCVCRQGEVVDQMQDKTDSVDLVVDVNGQPFDDYRDVGNK